MNEIQRRSYLDAMGVAVFYLKQPIPHAKQSPIYLIPEETLEPIDSGLDLKLAAAPSSRGNEQSKETAHSELARIRQQLQTSVEVSPEDKAAIEETAVKLAEAPVANQEVSGTEDTKEDVQAGAGSLQFKLNYYVINGSVAVLDEQPYAQAGRSDRERLDLLRNILAALEVDYTNCDFKAETIAWPLEPDMIFEESADTAAQQMLNGFVAQKHRSHGFEHLLVFAGSLEALLEENKGAMAAHFSMTITSSLSALLAYPELKRQVWQQLKPLIPLLARA